MCERNYSEATKESYQEALVSYETFVSELIGQFDPLKPELDYARAWMASMSKKGMKVATIKRRCCALRSYYKFLRREKLVSSNPLSLLPSPKVPKPLPVWVPEVQMNAILDDIDYGDDFTGKRDRLLIDLIYSTGMRRAEAAGLKSADVDFGTRVIRILGKGKKTRLVPFGEELCLLLKSFEEEKLKLFGKDTYYLLTDENGFKLSGYKVAAIAHKYLSTIPTLARPTIHVLRHSFATNMLANGADLMTVKELLGHASLQSTEVYTHLTPQEILANYKQAHPRVKK